MDYRLLGHGALRVSAIGLGCMSMSGTYGKSDDAASIAVIHRALDLGINYLDSSDMYGWGHNEELVRRALAGRREGVVLATKFGQVRSPDGAGNLVDGSATYVRSACEASLKRLGVDTIDLYYQHRVDPKVSIEETVGAMARLREEGKIRALGLCEAAPTTLRRAHAVHPITALQMEYSLLYRQPAEDVLAVCRELGIAFVAYSPLGRSLLAGGSSVRTTSPRTTAGVSIRGSRGRISSTTPGSCGASPRSRGPRAQPRPNSRSPGSWPEAATSSRSRGRSGSTGSRRTSAPYASGWMPTIFAASTRRCRPARGRARGTLSPR
jgi:aryl-alcohol dehydrogenase-like predicted oxidoreductase